MIMLQRPKYYSIKPGHILLPTEFTAVFLGTLLPAAAWASTKVTAVYPQSTHAFVLTEEGKLWSWVDNNHGKLGDDTTIDRPVLARLMLDNVESLYPQSAEHTFTLRKDGTLWAWRGDNRKASSV